MSSEALAPHRCRVRDLVGLIGMLAVLEGELTAGEVPHHLAGRLRARLQRAGLPPATGDEPDLARTLGDLNQRLRQALGEYDEAAR